MAQKGFTKESAGLPHKRGGKMELSDKQKSKVYLDLCEEMTGKRRGTIVIEFIRNKLSPSIVGDVDIYLRGRIEEIPEKIERVEVSKVKPKLTMADIMKKISDKPAPITTPITPGVYVPPTDKFGFYED